MANITDATFSISGIVTYADNTTSPINVVFGYNSTFIMDGSEEAMCEIDHLVPELIVDLNNNLQYTCTHDHRVVTDFILTVSGIVTYDDNTTTPYLKQYRPTLINTTFSLDPLVDAIDDSPISDEISDALEAINIEISEFQAVPTDVAAAAGDGFITLTWTAAANATSYRVKQSLTTDGPYTVIGTPTATTFDDTGLTNGTVYYYVISAIGPTGESVDSDEVNGMPNLADNAMQAVGFNVPFTTTVDVSGGGSALQTAITAAGADMRLRITDSLAYSPISISSKTNLTIDVKSGRTPSITAVAGSGNKCISIGAGNSGLAIKKLTLNGSANENTLSSKDNGLIWGHNDLGMTNLDKLIIEDCIFSEPAPATSGVPGIQLGGTNGTVHTNVWVHRCTFKNNAAGANVTGYGYGACSIYGFTNVFVQNCKLIRETAVIARGSSHMRGVVIKANNVWVENVLCEDLGTAGSNEAFKHNDEAAFGSVVGTSTWRNNVAYNCKRGYRLSLVSATMNTKSSVFHNDVATIAAAQVIVRRDAGTHNCRDTVIAGVGDGTAFSAVLTEDHNDIFNVAAPGKTLDVTDLTVDPSFHNKPNRNFTADAVSLQTGAFDGGLIGVRYTNTGEAIIWATP